MFQEHYGFTSLPFSKNIPTKDLFPTDEQKEITGRLTYLVHERGFGLVTGEIGSGKSTVVRTFSAGLDANRYLVIYLANPTTGMTGLYRDLLYSLGHEPPYTAARMVARIRLALTDLQTTKRRFAVIVLDEAHLLTQPMLEQFRLLCSDKMDSESLATLILVGQPSLRQTLHLSVNEAFQQRLAVRAHLGPLDLQETLGYVRHHVKIAGYPGPTLFSDDAVQRIFEYTKGIPRRINQLCTTALMAGMLDRKQILDESSVRKAIAEIGPD
jgi:type II secretory pathway predicted ATPase ExeA